MKKLIALIIGLCLSCSAMAQNWDTAVIVGGAVGTVVASQYAIYQSLIKRELKGWANKDTGTSVKLENQCGIQTEFHLIGDYKQNYIMIAITNTSGQQVALNFRQVKYTINGTSERFPGYSYQVSDQLVNNGWWVLAHIPLPRKSDFAEYDHLKVEVPIFLAGAKEPCKIVTEFKRTGHYTKEDVTYNIFDFMFDLGPSIAQTGNVTRLGKPDFIWATEFNWYLAPYHGIGMSFQLESGFDGTRKAPLYNGTIFSTDVHYVYRQFISPKLTFNFEPGLGYQALMEDYSCRYCDQSLGSSFMIDYRLMLQYVVGGWKVDEVDIMNFFVGGGIVQQYGFSSDTNGSRLGLLFRLGMGF